MRGNSEQPGLVSLPGFQSLLSSVVTVKSFPLIPTLLIIRALRSCSVGSVTHSIAGQNQPPRLSNAPAGLRVDKRREARLSGVPTDKEARLSSAS